MKFELNMSDPLTLTMIPGLKTGMDHPVTDRIRRLTMRKTNKFTQLGTFALILGGLGLSAPIVSTVGASEPEAIATLATLKLNPETLDPEIEKEMNRRRFAVADGTMPITALTEWAGMHSNRVSMTITENGPREVVMYDVKGTEITGADKEVALASLSSIFELCASHAQSSTTPDHYKMPSGSTGRVYNAECTPTVKKNAAELTADEKISIIMSDEDLDYETRQAKALGVKIRQLIAEFQATTPNPTRAQYYDRCIYESDILNEGYRVDSVPKRSKSDLQSTCEQRTQRKYGAVSE